MRYLITIVLSLLLFFIIVGWALPLIIFDKQPKTKVKYAYIERINILEKKVEVLQKRIDEINNITAKATAYNAVPEQTDNEPGINACRKNPRIGRVAVSQDLFYKGWTCGKWIAIKGYGIFQIDDVMHKRKSCQVDIIKETKKQANKFGIKKNINAVLLTHYERL